jgi:hypothetical protein
VISAGADVCFDQGPAMRLPRPFLILAATLPALVAAGCFKAAPAADSAPPARHHHHPPHHGTPIVLGDEDYHVELVLDAATGTLQAFVLDDEMENFVRSSTASIVISAGAGHEVTLAAVPNPETGETVGDTALFEGHADWLKDTPLFDGVLKAVTIRGTTYKDVKFNFPHGNDPDA